MTTKKKAFSRRNSGNVAAGQRHSALLRQCPNCRRKGAIVTERENTGLDLIISRACRWCDFTEGTVIPLG